MSFTKSSTSCECPICFQPFPLSVLERHASECDGNPKTDARSNKRSLATEDDDNPAETEITSDAKRSKMSAESVATPPSSSPLNSSRKKPSSVPLAERMRPSDLSDYLGQEEVTGAGSLWRKLIEQNSVPSLILWGPPGCGKTTLAGVISKKTRELGARFVKLSACTSGVADVKEVVKVAQNDAKMFGRKTVLFVDEVHRFNKTQQDAFLPHVESGTITLIGATTENPSFSLNSALLSRCRVIVLKKLSPESVREILVRAVREEKAEVDKEALDYLSNVADGDARTALNSLQIALDSLVRDGAGSVSLNAIREGLSRAHVLYDRKGDEHYHAASALQKSIRGSDDNAALYWCMRMLEGGEDPIFIARRLVRMASEDIGIGDPAALPMAVAAMQACQLIGMPECNVVLAHCCVYLARAKKSHEIMKAMGRAVECIREAKGNLPGVPIHLRNASSRLASDLGYGKGYSHELNEVGGIAYMPEGLKDKNFFR